MPWLTEFIGFFAVVIGMTAIVVLMIVAVVRRGRDFAELRDHGVDATATIVARRKSTRSGPARTHVLTYEYTDRFGNVHRRSSSVMQSVWDAHEIGSPFAIVYSERRQEVSAPKYLVDVVREAKAAR